MAPRHSFTHFTNYYADKSAGAVAGDLHSRPCLGHLHLFLVLDFVPACFTPSQGSHSSHPSYKNHDTFGLYRIRLKLVADSLRTRFGPNKVASPTDSSTPTSAHYLLCCSVHPNFLQFINMSSSDDDVPLAGSKKPNGRFKDGPNSFFSARPDCWQSKSFTITAFR